MSNSAVSRSKPGQPETALDRFSIWIIAALTILYIASFPIHRLPMLVAIPVVATGWFYRVRGGVIASILTVFLDLFLISIHQGGNTWEYL